MEKIGVIRKLNRKAQAGETMTWVVATIIIVVLTFIFIFVANLLGTGSKALAFFSDEENFILQGEKESFGGSSIRVQQMLFALIKNPSAAADVEEIRRQLLLWNSQNVSCDFGSDGEWVVLTDGEKSGELARFEYSDERSVMLRC